MITYNLFFLASYREGQHAKPLTTAHRRPGEKIVASSPKDIADVVLKYHEMGYEYVGKEEVAEGIAYNILFIEKKNRRTFF